jgi:hypothetical protein
MLSSCHKSSIFVKTAVDGVERCLGLVASKQICGQFIEAIHNFEQELLPAFTRGEQRQRNPVYKRLCVREQYYRKQGNRGKALELPREHQTLSERDPLDPDYRRLRFVRYADDFCLGFAGPKEEAEQIKHLLKTFLQEQLKLELSEEKTLDLHINLLYFS